MQNLDKRRINTRAIIYRDGKILAVKHKHGDEISFYYAAPGGGLDPHESLTDGLIRELREETGISSTVIFSRSFLREVACLALEALEEKR